MISEEQIIQTNKIYLAPLQGFTDFVYRKAFNEVFRSVDSFFIPYISVKNDSILKKYEKEILPGNNPQKCVIPQVLPQDATEMLYLAKVLADLGYTGINLNMGCPYPMVTNRGRGAGLLPHPDKMDEMLSAFFTKTTLKLSVKLRAGLYSDKEIEQVLPVLNRFPLTEIILHPRIAKQLYTGEIIEPAFQFAAENSRHQLVYNGDICSVADYMQKKGKFSGIENWMIGRGILMNPFLPGEIKGTFFSDVEKSEKRLRFHSVIFEEYQRTSDNPGNVLNKMKQFWIYFSMGFENPKKCYKLIKKANHLSAYSAAVKRIFNEFS